MSGHAKRVASALALVLACSMLTAGAAFAHEGGGKGKSDEAPGQQNKAEESQQTAAPTTQVAAQEEQAAAAEVTQTSQAAGKSGEAPGRAKKEAGSAASTKSTGQAKQEVRASGPGVKPSNTTSKWTTCTTGGGTGSSATCSGAHSSKADSSKQYGNGKTAAQIANERGAPAGTVLTGPGNSQPHKVAVCPRKANKSGGVDVHAVKSFSTAACAEQQQQQQQQREEQQQQQQVTQQPTVTPAPTQVAQPTAPTPPAAGVAGVQVPVQQPAAAQPAGQGGVLGALARVGRGGVLPFTGLPLWLAALAAFALLGGGFAVRRVSSA